MASAAPPRPAPSAPRSAPPALPSGARCAVHEEAPAVFVCRRCGTFACGGCAFGSRVAPIGVCRSCAEGGLAEPVPWERRKELGLWRAFWQTSRLVSRQPTAFFRTPMGPHSTGPALLFGVGAYLVGQTFAILVYAVLLMLAGGGAFTLGASGWLEEGPAQLLAIVFGAYGGVLLILAPLALVQGAVTALFWVVLTTAGNHLSLAGLGAAKATFEESLRVTSYAYAVHAYAWPLFALVPGCGPLAGSLWLLWVEMVGTKETHRCSTDRALLAILGWRVLLAFGLLALYVAVVAIAISLEAGR